MTICAQAETKLSPVKSVAARQTMESPGVFQLIFPLLHYVFVFESTRYVVRYYHLGNKSNNDISLHFPGKVVYSPLSARSIHKLSTSPIISPHLVSWDIPLFPVISSNSQSERRRHKKKVNKQLAYNNAWAPMCWNCDSLLRKVILYSCWRSQWLKPLGNHAMPISHICFIPAVKISHLPNFPILSVLQRIPLWNLILSMPFKPFLDVVFSNVFSGQIYFSGGYYIFLLHRLVSVGSSFTTFDLEGPVLQSVWGCYPVLSCYSWGNIQWVHIFCLKYCEFCYHHTQGWVYRIENLSNADISDFFVYRRVYHCC